MSFNPLTKKEIIVQRGISVILTLGAIFIIYQNLKK